MCSATAQYHLKTVIEEYSSYWRNETPIASILNGGVVKYGNLENLSKESFHQQIYNLKRLKKKINQTYCGSNEERILKKEVIRSINLKLYTLEFKNPYTHSLSSYLKIITTSLYIYKDVMTRDFGLKVYFLQTVLNWLKSASDNDITILEKDINYLKYLVKYFHTNLNSESSKVVSKLLDEITKQCSKFVIKEIKINKRNLDISQFDILLRDCYGLERDIHYWEQIIIETLYSEIEVLEQKNEELNDSYIKQEVEKELIQVLISDLYNLETKIKIPVYEKEKFEVEILPTYFRYFVGEGFYLHNNKDKKLLISREMTRMVYNKRDLAFLYTFLAHEIYPGHHNHLSAIKDIFIKKHIDCLYNPIGLEGWAVLSETVLEKIELGSYAKLFNLRRLVPIAVYLEKMLNGKKSADALVNDIFNKSDVLNKEFRIRGGFGAPNIVYTLGYLEYKMVLKEYNLTAHDILSYGPITPSNAAKLVN